MKERNIHWCKVVYSEYKSQENAEIEAFVLSWELEFFIKNLEAHTIIVLWWDGSLLEAIATYSCEYKNFIGINFWNKGFLMHPKSITLQKNFSFEKREYPLLACQIGTETFFAFNEFDIKAGEGKMLDIVVHIGWWYRHEILGDGILLSSPAWSTGYSSSFGGPILAHSSNSYILTPKAPWKPKRLPPIILSSSQEIELETQGRKSIIEIYADGRSIKTLSEHLKAKISFLPGEVTLFIEKSQLKNWDGRVLEEQGFCQEISEK